MFYSVRGVKRQLHWNSSFCSILFDWFENRTDSKIGVRFCSIAEPNQTIGVRLGSIGFLFGFIRLDRAHSPQPGNDRESPGTQTSRPAVNRGKIQNGGRSLLKDFLSTFILNSSNQKALFMAKENDEPLQ